MKKIILFVLSLCLCFTVFGGSAFAESAADAPAETPARTTRIEARFASVEEGQQAMRNRILYHEQINEANLAFLLQKKGGTLEEYIDYAAEQVLPFTEEDEQAINDALDWLQQQLESHGLTLPDPGPITYVKSTMKEDSGAGGYTSEGCIFLNEMVFAAAPAAPETMREYVVHETFHCLSRLFPEFRQAMYALIGFRVLDEDIDIPQNLKDQFVANPDVEHHNSVATFTINGEKKECYLLFMTDDVFEKPGDKFFDHAYSYIVPVGESTGYRTDEVPDFWDVVGRNTDYVEDPEEAMASNFWLAMKSLDDGYADYKSPEILEGIIDILKAGNEAP